MKEPLIHLKSVKLPFLIYANRYGDRGAEPYKVFKEGEKLVVKVDAHVVERERVEEVKGKLYALIEGSAGQLELKPETSVADGTLHLRLEIESADISGYIVKDVSDEDKETMGFVFARLAVDQDNLAVNYPIIVVFNVT